MNTTGRITTHWLCNGGRRDLSEPLAWWDDSEDLRGPSRASEDCPVVVMVANAHIEPAEVVAHLRRLAELIERDAGPCGHADMHLIERTLNAEQAAAVVQATLFGAAGHLAAGIIQ